MHPTTNKGTGVGTGAKAHASSDLFLGWLRQVLRGLSQPTDGASLALFRICFGAIMLLEAVSLFLPSESSAGKIMLEVYYTGSNITQHFPYPGFEWLPWLQAPAMYALAAIMGVCALLMTIGFAYRITSACVFLIWAYFYAIESTRTYWMSYYYLELLVSFLMIWVPAARCWSIDARLKWGASSGPEVPFWSIFLLRAQLVIMYFYAGLAKVNADWLLDAQPVRYFLSQPHVEAAFTFLPVNWQQIIRTFLQSDFLAYVISHAGAFFDLTVGFLLLHRRTRFFGLAMMVIFHGFNHSILFDDIIWFPILGLASSLIFLEPDWPRRLARWIRKPGVRKPDARWAWVGGICFPLVGVTLGWKDRPMPRPAAQPALPTGIRWQHVLVLCWIIGQTLFPLRHYAIPGDTRITFEGLSWSWRLKAEVYRSKPCDIRVVDETLVSQNEAGKAMIHWADWKGDRILYRQLDIHHIDWSSLPEILVIKEPELGERILFNTYASPKPLIQAREISSRLATIWNEMYQRKPNAAHPIVSLDSIVEAYGKALEQKGHPHDNPSELLTWMMQTHGPAGDGQIMPMLRRMQPFGLMGAPEVEKRKLFVVEDVRLFYNSHPKSPRVDRQRWITSSYTLPGHIHVSDPASTPGFLPLHLPIPGQKMRLTMPQASLVEDLTQADQEGPFVSWDYLQDLTISKAMHISTSPFLIQRYADRVADQWETRTGRRPRIHATTAVSLNFRPYQAVVDPSIDLAGVRVRHFSHNPWIRHLELERIPPEQAGTRWSDRR